MQFSHPFIFSLFCVFASLREILFCLALFIQNVLTPSRKGAKNSCNKFVNRISLFYSNILSAWTPPSASSGGTFWSSLFCVFA